MRVEHAVRTLCLALATSLSLFVGTAAHTQSDRELNAMHQEVLRLHDQGRYGDAARQAERLADLLKRRLGENDPNYAAALNNAGFLYQQDGRLREAEPLMRRALALREKQLPAGHARIAVSQRDLGTLLMDLGQFAEALTLLQRAAESMERANPRDDVDLAVTLNNLALLHREQGRLAEAEQVYLRSLAIRERVLPPDHRHIAVSLISLSGVYQAQGRLSEAERLLVRGADIMRKGLPPGHPDVARVENNLGGLYEAQGRLAEAEAMYKRSLEIRQKSLPANHPELANSFNNLASLYHNRGRHAEAQPMYERALSIRRVALPAGHPDIATTLNNLGELHRETGHFAEAEPLHREALAIRRKSLPADHPDIAESLNNLALLAKRQGRPAEALTLLQEALVIRERSLPANHPEIASSVNNIAVLHKDQGRFAEAEPLYRRALAMREKVLPEGHRDIFGSLGNLAVFSLLRDDAAGALAYLRRATRAFVQRSAREGSVRTGAVSEIEAGSAYFRLQVLAAHRAGGEPALREESFEMAQWAERTAAASALAQTAARQAKGEGDLARLVRERQDLAQAWQAIDALLVAALGRGNTALVDNARKQAAEVDKRLSLLDAKLKQSFPEYAALADPKPLSIAETQALLGPDEALLQVLDMLPVPGISPQSFAWLISKTEARWVKLDLPTSALAREAQALRCGLDHTQWQDGRADACRALVGAAPVEELVGATKVAVLPFDLARAHRLYQVLLGWAPGTLSGKRLLVVPSASLSSLPFHVLVTEPPRAAIPGVLAEYRRVAWLGSGTAVTVLPSVASLRALRAQARTGTAKRPYLGVGNPLLDGQQSHAQWGEFYRRQAKAARERQSCGRPVEQAAPAQRWPFARLASLARRGQSGIERVRELSPLPDTADELCEVGRQLGVADDDILLGSRATEATLKGLSERGRLSEYAIVHFATHGAVAGELQGSVEPGLVLTPPARGTNDLDALDRDDGYLAASEITALRLDADWVVLSACNTAAGSGEGAESLSGLARAFLYAGARALLVSHWEVGSAAAVKLTTRTFAELKANPALGRAEALRISMRALSESGSPAAAHPSEWAPFTVVGGGDR
jgi:tetratricopeptide (TPR) repeat protein/CHAT domain-containing protein